nr:histone deacetylase 14 [Tanacetum cinerariifolium]
MADENVPVPTPTRSDDQILPFAAWNTLTYEAKTGAYSFQLDETQFILDVNLLKDALEITPIDQAYQFVSPLTGDAIMDFVNELGYTYVIHFVSRTVVNNLHQPWRVILFMIKQCLIGKTLGFDRPRYPVLQMLWGNNYNPTKEGKKYKPYVILYCRFTKLIICHLGRIQNIHPRSTYQFHLAKEDIRLGNLKFIPKGKKDEVFGMLIPNELISNNIRNASYYSAYLEMVAKHNIRITVEKEGKKQPTTAKQPKPKPANEKLIKQAPVLKPKATKEKTVKPSPAKPSKMGKVLKT